MSPASSAATRAAGSLMKRKVTFLSLTDLASRKPSHLTSVTELPFFQSSNLNGPVPIGLVAALAALFGCRITAVFSPMRNRKLPSALFSVRITVCGSGAAIELMLSNTRLLGLVGALLVLGALEAELHGRRVEGLAVVELHALAQLEGVALAVRVHRPALGQQRRDRAVDVDLGQAFEDVVVHDLADRRGRRDGRVQPVRLEHHADRDAVLLALGQRRGRRPGHRQRRAGGQRNQGAAAERHLSLRGMGNAGSHARQDGPIESRLRDTHAVLLRQRSQCRCIANAAILPERAARRKGTSPRRVDRRRQCHRRQLGAAAPAAARPRAAPACRDAPARANTAAGSPCSTTRPWYSTSTSSHTSSTTARSWLMNR